MSRVPILFGVVIPLIILSTVFVALRLAAPFICDAVSQSATDLVWWIYRFYCRYFVIHRVGPDDWIMLAALVCPFGFLGFVGLLLTWMVAECMGYRLVLELYTVPCVLPSKATQVF